MKKIKLLFTTILMLVIVFSLSLNVFADVAKFGTTNSSGGGGGKNPFNPRGYFIKTTYNTTEWISSKFITPPSSAVYDGLGHTLSYSGTYSGVDIIDATKVSGLYAVTDRNPTPGYKYLMGLYKKSKNESLKDISGFSGYIQTPGRYDLQDPNGDAGWTIPINMKLEPGTIYEFGFLCGMQANNGTSCVLAADNTGYLKNPMTAEEQALYNQKKNDEYKFITSVTENPDGTCSITEVEMRYKVQTLADTSAWQKKAAEVQRFINSLRDAEGYDQAKLNELKNMLAQYNQEATNDNTALRRMLQKEADAKQTEMINDITQAVEAVKSDSVQYADLTEYNKQLREAKDLYKKTKSNTGTKVGQYGATQVKALGVAIQNAELKVTKNSPKTVVDEEVLKLKQAIATVKMSQVTEGLLKFYDSTTGIFVTAKKGSLPDGVRLYVAQEKKSDTSYTTLEKAYEKSAGKKPKDLIIYTIKFYVDKKEVQPTSEVTIQIPVISAMQAKNTQAFSVSRDSSVAKLNSKLTSGVHSFGATKMGLFAIIESDTQVVSDSKQADAKIAKRDSSVTDPQKDLKELKDSKANDTNVDTPDSVAEKTPNTIMGKINLDEIKKDVDSDAVMYIIISFAGFGVLVGGSEFIRGKKKTDMQ